MRIGVFAGSFCPVTKGHVDAIEKAAKLVDKLYVVMGVNTNKSYAISKQARFEMLSRSINHIQNVQAVAFDGMLTEYCKQVNASVMIKSVRNAMKLTGTAKRFSLWEARTTAIFPVRWFASWLC